MRTVVGEFPSYDAAKLAVERLKNLGLGTDDISIICGNTSRFEASESDVDHTAQKSAGAGALIGGAGAALAAVVLPGVGPVMAAGWLASAIGGAIAGGAVGGAAGAAAAETLDLDHQHDRIADGISRGGTVVAVKVHDSIVGPVERLLATDPDGS